MTQGCQLLQRSKFGSFLVYTDRGGNLLSGAALRAGPFPS